MAKSSGAKKTKAKPSARPKKPAAKKAAKPSKATPKKVASKTSKGGKGSVKTVTKPTKKTSKKPAAAAAAEKKSPSPTKEAKAKKPSATQKPAPPAKAPAKSAETPAEEKKAPKGITVVSPKTTRRAPMKATVQMPVAEPLLKPGGKWKPLIPSGPKAGGDSSADENSGGLAATSKKSKMTKRELDMYRKILLKKREELVGDVSNMEDEALRGSGSGSLSHTPQHMAEQGSDAYDQSLSLDLAAADRQLIREIDEALKRIANGTYGLCEVTGKRIRPERLEELPWARYSIEAARELERRSFRP